MWAGVFVVAATGVFALTRRRELRQNMPFWSPVKRRIVLTILPAAVAGVGLTVAIAYRWYYGDGPNEWGLVTALWMTFCGVACWQVGDFSIPEIRIMGASFILAGLVTGAFYQFSPYLALGVTSGGFHIVYGIIVWIRHGG